MQEVRRSEHPGTEPSSLVIHSIGQELEDFTTATFGFAAKLRPLLTDHDAAELDRCLREVEGSACRIAVFGPLGSGKSTLINTLIRRPGFLPVGAGLSTTVLTELHLGSSAEPGAAFQLFSTSEWATLATGGELAGLAKELAPDSDLPALQANMRRAEQRAEQRLGRQLVQALGKRHRFALVTTELLQRYVCGAAPPSSGQPSGEGQRPFAEITKSAEIFLEVEPFGHPATLIDTPGTDDPLSLRHEISRLAIEGADAFILVLDAARPLSEEELSVVRLLRGLPRERLIVFINRIDRLASETEDSIHALVEQTRACLQAKLADAPFTILAGCAETEARAGTVLGSHVATSAPSGLSALERTLSRLVLQGPTMLRLLRCQQRLLALTGESDLRARSILHSLRRVMESTVSENIDAGSGNSGSPATPLTDEAPSRIEDALARLPELAATGQRQLEGIASGAASQLREVLSEVVAGHLATAREESQAQTRSMSAERLWRYDASQLCSELRNHCTQIYGDTALRLEREMTQVSNRIRAEAEELLCLEALATAQVPLRRLTAVPPLSALAEAAIFELNGPWDAWWRRWQNPQLRARRFQEVLRQQTTRLLDELLRACLSSLSAYVEDCRQTLERWTGALCAALDARQTLLRAGSSFTPSAPQGHALLSPWERLTRENELSLALVEYQKIASGLTALSSRCSDLGTWRGGSAG